MTVGNGGRESTPTHKIVKRRQVEWVGQIEIHGCGKVIKRRRYSITSGKGTQRAALTALAGELASEEETWVYSPKQYISRTILII